MSIDKKANKDGELSHTQHCQQVANMILLAKFDDAYEYIVKHCRSIALKQDVYTSIGNHKFEQNEYEEALRMYKRIRGECADIYLNIAYCYQKVKRTRRALGFYRKYLEIYTNNTYCINNIAVLCYYSKDYEGALAMYNKMSDSYIADHALHFHIGVCHYHMNEYSTALDYFAKCGKSSRSSIYMAWIYAKKLHNYDEAIAMYAQLSRDTVNDKDLEFDIAWCYQESEKYKEAMRYYELYLAKHPRNVNTLHNIAWIRINIEDDANGAKPLLLSILSIDKHHFYANYTYGVYLRDVQRDYELALTCLRIALKRQPHNVEIAIDIAKTYREMDDMAHATHYYDKAIASSEDDCHVVIEYAHFCALIGKYEQADMYYNKALRLIQSCDESRRLTILNGIHLVDCYTNYAHVLFKLGKTCEAAAVVKRACVLDSDNCNALNNLGYYLYLMSDYSQAQKYLTMCLALNPEHEFTNSTLANVLFETERFDEALVYFERAVQLDADMQHTLMAPKTLHRLCHTLYYHVKDSRQRALACALRIVNKQEFSQYKHLDQVYYLLANLHNDNKSRSLALKFIERACQLNSQSAQYKSFHCRLKQQ